MMIAITVCGAVCGTATATPFGIQLGKVVEIPPPRTDPTNSPSLQMSSQAQQLLQIKNELRENREKRFASNTLLPLDAPFFGITQATTSTLSGPGASAQVRYQFTISNAFRRGLQRKESLAKINELREETARRVGFDLGAYTFSTSELGEGVPAAKGGEDVWLWMDTAFARCVTTNDDIEVELTCAVNPTKATRRSHRLRGNTSISSAIQSEDRTPIENDSPTFFSVTVTKLSARDAELKRREEERARLAEEQRLQAEHKKALSELKLSEFYGIGFGRPSGISTNTLERQESEHWSETGNVTNHYLYAYWKKSDETLRPCEFFDFGEVIYSYESVTPLSAEFRGHFPEGLSRKECIARLDALSADMKAKYGIELSNEFGYPKEDEPADVAKASVPEGTGRERYEISKGHMFYRGIFYNSNIYVYLVAGETRFGERCVRLWVDDSWTSRYIDEGLMKNWQSPRPLTP